MKVTTVDAFQRGPKYGKKSKKVKKTKKNKTNSRLKVK